MPTNRSENLRHTRLALPATARHSWNFGTATGNMIGIVVPTAQSPRQQEVMERNLLGQMHPKSATRVPLTMERLS